MTRKRRQRVVIIKEKNMKKFITAIIAIMVLALTCASFVACDNEDIDLNANAGFGGTMPDVTPAKAISGGMTATQMLMAAEENYYNASFVASTSTGKIDTEVAGLAFTQFVNSDKIRNGSVTSGEYTQFSNNLSGSIGSMDLVKIWEETFITKSASGSEILFRNVDKDNLKVNKKNYTLSIKDGKSFNETKKYNNLEDYQSDTSANPELIWMYNINEDTVIADQCTKPEHNETDKTYSFTVVADPDLSTKDYQEQMMYMLEAQSGITPAEFAFQTIKLEVVMWENGFIKSLTLTESYYMRIEMWIIKLDTTITLNSQTYYTYYDNETGFTSGDLTNKKFA